jgi:hypothetical protein
MVILTNAARTSSDTSHGFLLCRLAKTCVRMSTVAGTLPTAASVSRVVDSTSRSAKGRRIPHVASQSVSRHTRRSSIGCMVLDIQGLVVRITSAMK